jgi:hypothetical protein
LTQRFGAQSWIDQVVTAVKNAVQNGIKNLSGTAVSSNSHPGDGYRFQARTKDELLQSQQLAASAREVGRKDRPMDPAAEKLQSIPVDDNGVIIIPGAGRQHTVPSSPKAKQPEGWIL